MENWGDESVPVTRPRLDWLNLTGFVYLRLSQSSNVSKRLNCLSFQTCKCSSACGKLSGGTAEVLSYVAIGVRDGGQGGSCPPPQFGQFVDMNSGREATLFGQNTIHV